MARVSSVLDGSLILIRLCLKFHHKQDICFSYGINSLLSFSFSFLAALGLHCCAWAFFSCGEQGLLFVAVRGLLTAVASLCCRARALGAWASVVVACGLSSCGSWALECRLSSCGAWA